MSTSFLCFYCGYSVIQRLLFLKEQTLGKYSAICYGEPLPSVFVLDAKHPLFGVCYKAEHVWYHIIPSNKLLIEWLTCCCYYFDVVNIFPLPCCVLLDADELLPSSIQLMAQAEGFGKLYPSTRPSQQQDEHSNDEDEFTSNFISRKELEKGRLSREGKYALLMQE